MVGDVAAGQQRERAEAQALPEKKPALDRAYAVLPQHRLGVLERFDHADTSRAGKGSASTSCAGARPVIMVGSVLGTMMTSATCTMRNSTMALMPRKWMRRAVSNPPNSQASS